MKIVRVIVAFLVAVLVTYFIASIFYTMQVVEAQAAFAPYTRAQQIDTFLANLGGLWIYGALIAIALCVAFFIAWIVKKILPALSPVAYPTAGAAAIFVLLTLIETQLGGGAGIIGGARTPAGVALQCLAGLVGGGAFALLRPRV